MLQISTKLLEIAEIADKIQIIKFKRVIRLDIWVMATMSTQKNDDDEKPNKILQSM